MNKDSLLISKAKKGDKKAFNQLVNNNLYLINYYLETNNYNENNKDDIIQDGYLLLIEYITNYIKKENEEYLSTYLHKRIKEKMKSIIKKYDYNDDVQEYNNHFIFDFVEATEQKELVEILIKFIIGTDTFTFMQKNTLLAKLGFIENRVLTNEELASAFNCSNTNFYIKYIDSIGKLRKAIVSKKIEKDKVYHMDLFSYFNTSKEILIDVIKKNLNEKEIFLLKLVWGEDFSCFNKLEDIILIEEDALAYYKVIGKLYNIIINLDLKEENFNLDLGYGYALRR